MDIELLRASELKAQLIEYAGSDKYKTIHDRLLSGLFDSENIEENDESDAEDESGNENDNENETIDEIEPVKAENLSPEQYYNFLDWFILELKHEDDRTILSRFIDEKRAALSPDDIRLLEGWRNVFESVFKIKDVMEDGFIALNILNLKTYMLKPTLPMSELASIQRGTFISGRVVPVKNYFTFSGVIAELNFENLNDCIDYIAEILSQRPELYFQDNEEGLEKAKKVQEYERKLFIEHFGDDIFVTSGDDLRETFEEFHKKSVPLLKEYRRTLNTAAHGGKRAMNLEGVEDMSGLEAIFEEYAGKKSVGIIYDAIEGLNFYPDYACFDSMFSGSYEEEGQEYTEDEKQDTLKRYLEDQKISTLPFYRMFQYYPQNSLILFSALFDFNPKEFDYRRDLEKYLYPYKSYFYKTVPMPSVLPIEFEDFIYEIMND